MWGDILSSVEGVQYRGVLLSLTGDNFSEEI